MTREPLSRVTCVSDTPKSAATVVKPGTSSGPMAPHAQLPNTITAKAASFRKRDQFLGSIGEELVCLMQVMSPICTIGAGSWDC